MERVKARAITAECLLDNCSNKEFYTNLFEVYLNKGMPVENIPVSPLYFDNICGNNNQIFIEEKVYKELKKIIDVTMVTNYEIPYFMIGFEQENGSIVFKEIIADKNQNSMSSADYEKITSYVANFLSDIDNNDIKIMGKPIICKGHTHGRVGFEYDNFSFGDLVSYVTFKEQIRDCVRTYNKKGVNCSVIDTVGMLINPCGDFNFVYYDEREGQAGFYKFTNIFLRTRDNKIMLLPSMSDSGNYIRKDDLCKRKL